MIPTNFLDVNEASAFQRAWLSGVGKNLADKIIQQCPFESLDALPDQVDGLGPATLEEMRPLVQVFE